MPWIFNEDLALKTKLSGLTVTDVNAPNGRPVAVRFRLPETELADLTFPCLIIEHDSITKDSEREHRGFVQIPYAPEGLPMWPDSLQPEGLDPAKSPYWSDYPIPYNIDYTVTLMSRKAVHHITLVGALAGQNRMPARFGGLDIPEDGTVRRLDLIGGPELANLKDVEGKRLFTATYLIRVSTELVDFQIQTFEKVLAVIGRIEDMDGTELEKFWVTYNGAPPDPL